MKKTVVYLILFVFSVYFSFVVGKILGDLEGGSSQQDEFLVEENYNGGRGGIVKYLVPFEGFSIIPESNNYGQGSYSPSSGESYSSPQSHKSITNSGKSGGGLGQGFSFSTEDKSKSARSSGGGGYVGGTSIKSSNRKSNNNGLDNSGLGGNPFGGLLAQVNKIEAQRNSGRGESNSIGTIGARVGNEEFNTLSGSGGPILEPTLIPLDNGSIVLIILGVLTGGWFIIRNIKKNSVAGA